MTDVHQKIIDAVIRKAALVCPGALELIGVYGSVATGDTHERSDLDLLVLINDDEDYQLAQAFILDDADVGYDIYCTGWHSLERDADCRHAHLAKLMDAQIVYTGNPASLQRLETLRSKASALLASPMCRARASGVLEDAKVLFADCFLTDSLAQQRTFASAVIHYVCDALMLFHGRYFHLGVKRTFEELAACPLPFDVQALVMAVIQAESSDVLRQALTDLLRAAQAHMSIPSHQATPCYDNLCGTYEEMYSNWRNKMYEATENDDLFSAFMNMAALQHMFAEVAQDAAIAVPEVLADYTPHDAAANAAAFDRILHAYLAEYEKAGMKPARYATVDDFIAAYLA